MPYGQDPPAPVTAAPTASGYGKDPPANPPGAQPAETPEAPPAPKAEPPSAAETFVDDATHLWSKLSPVPIPAPTAENMRRVERFASGLRDPLEGAAQLAWHAVPTSVERAIFGASGGPKTMDEAVKAREAAIADERKAHGETGTDVARLVGNVASPANYATGAISALGRIPALLRSAFGGATSAVLTPEVGDPKDYWKTKGKEALVGAALGPVAEKVGKVAAGVVKPQFAPDVEKLLAEGVSLTPGQMAGGIVKRGEDALRSVPILGNIIRGGQQKSVESFSEAAVNRALAPVGEKLPSGVKAGHEALAYAAGKLDQKYEALLPNLRGMVDAQLQKDLVGIAQLGANLPEPQKAQLLRIMQHEVMDRFTDGGVTSGRAIKDIESKLGGISATMRRSEDYDTRTLAGGIDELKASLRRMLDRVNPDYAGELNKVNEGWANLLRVQRAASSLGAKDGVFTPSQLLSATKALDRTKNKAAFARGGALQQDLAQAARDVIPQTIPDSGSPERLLWAGLAGAGGGGYLMHDPHALLTAALGTAASLPYTKPGMAAARQWATAAPQAREAVAAPMRAAVPYLSPAAAALMRQWLSSKAAQQ